MSIIDFVFEFIMFSVMLKPKLGRVFFFSLFPDWGGVYSPACLPQHLPTMVLGCIKLFGVFPSYFRSRFLLFRPYNLRLCNDTLVKDGLHIRRDIPCSLGTLYHLGLCTCALGSSHDGRIA